MLTRAAAPRPVFRGRWIATARPTVFHGNWSAQALPGSANEAIGSWTLDDDAGQVTLRGTWSARKQAGGWRGRWQAKVEPGSGTYAGTWQALPGPDFTGKTFEDLLRAGDGIRTQFGGTRPFEAQANAMTTSDIERAELVSTPILLVLLVLIFGSVVAAASPLLIGGVAILGAFIVTRLIGMMPWITPNATFAASPSPKNSSITG